MSLIFHWLQILCSEKILNLLKNIIMIKLFQFMISNTQSSCLEYFIIMNYSTQSFLLLVLSFFNLKCKWCNKQIISFFIYLICSRCVFNDQGLSLSVIWETFLVLRNTWTFETFLGQVNNVLVSFWHWLLHSHKLIWLH